VTAATGKISPQPIGYFNKQKSIFLCESDKNRESLAFLAAMG